MLCGLFNPLYEVVNNNFMTLRFFKWSSAVAYQELNLIVLFVTFLPEKKKKDLCDCSDNVKNSTTMKIYFPSSWFCTPKATAFFFFFFCKFSPFQVHFFSTSKPNWWPLHYRNTNKYGNKYGKSNFQHFTLIFYLSFILIQSGNYRPYIPWL